MSFKNMCRTGNPEGSAVGMQNFETEVIDVHFKMGLCSVSFRSSGPEEILAQMNKAGLSFIEWGSDIHAPCTNVKKLHQLAELQKRHGVLCSSYGTYFVLGKTPVEELRNYIQAARILGTDILRLWCGNKNAAEYTAEEKQALFRVCRQTADIAEAAGVTLCMECHCDTYTNTVDGALELMQTVDSPNFRMYWQPNQFRDEAQNLEYGHRISGYTKNIHVFNWRQENKFPLKEGISVWRRYLKCFCSGTLLLEFMPDGKLESLPEEAAALREITEDRA